MNAFFVSWFMCVFFDIPMTILNLYCYRLHGFPHQPDHFFSGMSNRVEHQKLNQEAAELPPG